MLYELRHPLLAGRARRRSRHAQLREERRRASIQRSRQALASRTRVALSHVGVKSCTIVAARHEAPQSILIQLHEFVPISKLQAHASTIAEFFDCEVALITKDPTGHVRLSLYEVDPFTSRVFGLPDHVMTTIDSRIAVARFENNEPFMPRLSELVHVAVQGSTGSGKSVETYGLIAQAVSVPDVIVAISDITGLLPRPFVGTKHEEWQVSGTANMNEHIKLLEKLVDEMDLRCTSIPVRKDQVEIGPDCPLIFFVLEEYPGLLRANNTRDRNEVMRLVERLSSEGRKAGIKLLILAQRFEAKTVGGFVRDQCSTRLSFRVPDPNSIRMLHDASPDLATAHATARPGIALLSAVGVPCSKVKTPYIAHGSDDTAYAVYWDEIVRRTHQIVPVLPSKPLEVASTFVPLQRNNSTSIIDFEARFGSESSQNDDVTGQ